MTVSSGTFYGYYEVLSAIGAGGMGEVYLARDSRLERKVALKLLLEKYTLDTELVHRFIQEAIAASALNHPNIITIYEIGQSYGTHYIATEFVEGETLRDKLKSRSMDLGEMIDIATQVAEGLSAAHQAGIIHRDIKPENIMIRRDGYVKILDFGLAKLTTGKETDNNPLTAKFITEPGLIMGTPTYMSPEQARGIDIDGRTDIWSLGVVLYEMLTGQLPFAGETIPDVLSAIISKEPPPLSQYALGCPTELENIIAKSLRKDKDERYASAKDFAADLKSVKRRLEFEEELERSGNSGATYNLRPVSLSAINTTGQKVSTTSASTKDALLLTEFVNLTRDSVFDDTLKIALAVTLEQSPFLDIFSDVRVRQTLKLMGRSPDERITREVGREICQRRGLKAYIIGTIMSLGTLYVLTLEAVNALTDEPIGRVLEQAESKEQVLKALGQAASGLREKLGESLSSIEKFDAPLELTTSSLEALKLYSQGFEYVRKGKFMEDIPFLKRAIELDPNFAYAYAGLAVDYANTNQPKLAAENATKAFELRDRVTELERLRVTYVYYSNVTGEIDKAIETLESWKQSYPRDVRPRNNLSHCYSRIGQYEKALAEVGASLQMDSNAIISNLNLASLLLSLNRFEEVRRACLNAFEKKLDSSYFHYCLYQLAFIEGNKPAMSEQLSLMKGRADEYNALEWQAGAAACLGQWKRAQDFSRRAIDMAVGNDAKGEAADYAAEQALRAAALKTHPDSYSFVEQSLGFERNQITLTRCALALALSGEEEKAQTLIDELNQEYPKSTLINYLWLPTIIAALELTCGEAKQSIELLESTKRYEAAADFYPQYIRALGFLKIQDGERAFIEFQKILTRRGESPSSVLYSLSYMGAARSLMLKGNLEKARKTYNYFFYSWQNADSDLRAMIEAKEEFENIGNF